MIRFLRFIDGLQEKDKWRNAVLMNACLGGAMLVGLWINKPFLVLFPLGPFLIFLFCMIFSVAKSIWPK